MAQPAKWLLNLPPIESFIELTSNAIREAILGALRQGPIPQHIAFVMDGNRRYARGLKKEVIEGHSAGFETLGRILEICYKIGVKIVTVYAFSIENFKRSKYEVDALMEMAKIRLVQLAEHGDLLHKYGARIKFVGRRDIFRPDVLEAIDHAMKLTENNGRAVLNIAAPYTSRDEMTTSIRETVAEYCQPIRPPLKRPFSESHIARNIQAQRLESGDIHPLQTIAEANKEAAEAAEAQTTSSESISYRPNSPETEASFQKFTDRLCEILEKTGLSPVDEIDVTAATNAALFSLKHGLYLDDNKEDESISVLNRQITGPDLQFLQSLADALHDYPIDQSRLSDTPTLADKSSPSRTPKAQFRDVELITADTLTAHTYTGIDVPPVDILIRTSGVERLSDFLLWQAHETTDIKFVKCMWPEFGLRQFLPILLEWQWRIRKEEVWDSADWSKIA